jgi:tryptophan halogenase
MARAEERSNFLLQLLKDVKIHGSERSFKVLDGLLLRNRFLLGVSKRSIGQTPDDTIVGICQRMGMPQVLSRRFKQKLPDVNFVLFGFEENEKTCVYKVYLEFYDKFPEHVKGRSNAHDPFLMHLGFKWDAFDNARSAEARYTWYPMLSVRNILPRMSGVYEDSRYRPSGEIAEKIFKIASTRMTRKDILYLEVAEENNSRRSYDINLYEANLRLRDLGSIVPEVCRSYSISPEEFGRFYEGVADERLGHLAGGIDREGRDFLTIYYEVMGIPSMFAALKPA